MLLLLHRCSVSVCRYSAGTPPPLCRCFAGVLPFSTHALPRFWLCSPFSFWWSNTSPSLLYWRFADVPPSFAHALLTFRRSSTYALLFSVAAQPELLRHSLHLISASVLPVVTLFFVDARLFYHQFCFVPSAPCRYSSSAQPVNHWCPAGDPHELRWFYTGTLHELLGWPLLFSLYSMSSP